MKAERSSARSSRVMSAAVALQMDTSSMLDTIGAVLPPSVRGIPEAELTPRVRDTIMAFLREMDGLKLELTQTRTRLDEVEKTADLDAVLPILNRRAFFCAYIASSALAIAASALSPAFSSNAP